MSHRRRYDVTCLLGIRPPLPPPQYFKPWPPQYSKPSYAYVFHNEFSGNTEGHNSFRPISYVQLVSLVIYCRRDLSSCPLTKTLGQNFNGFIILSTITVKLTYFARTEKKTDANIHTTAIHIMKMKLRNSSNSSAIICHQTCGIGE